MAKYRRTNSGSVQRDDGASIPPDPANHDWLEYLDWVAAGNDPDPCENGETAQVSTAPTLTLDAIKAALTNAVQTAFEHECAKIMTPGDAMTRLYWIKADAAFRYVGSRKLADQALANATTDQQRKEALDMIQTHPILEAGIPGDGATLDEVASLYIARNADADRALSLLDAKRRSARDAIAAATDETSARSAADVAW